MKTRINWLKIIGAFVLALATGPVHAASAQLTAAIDKSRIALGDSAQLTITVSGADGDSVQPKVPAIRGLDIRPLGQTSSFQSINGDVSASVSLMYQVTPNRAGTFTIPAIRLPGGASSRPMILHVSKGPIGASALPPANLPPPNVQSSTSDVTQDANDEPAFLRVVLPKQKLYVGELVPVQVKAYFRSGMAASLNGLPVLSSDAFTLNKLSDKPDQSEEFVGGRPYTVVTWSTRIWRRLNPAIIRLISNCLLSCV